MPQHAAGSAAPGAHDDVGETDEMRQRIIALQDDFAGVDRRLRAVLRERPLLALSMAVAGGFIVGRVIRRT